MHRQPSISLGCQPDRGKGTSLSPILKAKQRLAYRAVARAAASASSQAYPSGYRPTQALPVRRTGVAVTLSGHLVDTP
jgi:hypothetical protein